MKMVFRKKDKLIANYLKLSIGGVLIIICLAFTAYSDEVKVLFREDFHNLENWKPLTFPKIKKHTTYTAESDGNENYLKAESNSSASALVYKGEFNVYEYPKARWRWKIDNVYKKGKSGKKSGDDYPIRIYFLFKYDPGKASFLEKIKYEFSKKIYGEYPPHSSLNYVWSNRENAETIVTSPYTEKVKIVALQQGNRNIGKWITEEVNIIEDYKKAFGNNPHTIASLAIMNDSDNTGEKSISYVDFIEVYKDVQ